MEEKRRKKIKGFLNKEDADKYIKENEMHGYKSAKKGNLYYVVKRTNKYEDSLNNGKGFRPSYYVKIARQLCYSQDIIDRLKNAKTEREAECLLATGRKGGDI